MNKMQQTKPTASDQDGSRHLHKLPSELLIKICVYLCWHCQSAKPTTQVWQDSIDQIHCLIHSPTAALASLSRTCHRLNAIATPILYHGFSAAKVADMYKFIRTIRLRPELAHLVKAVFLEHVDVNDDSYDSDHYYGLICESLGSLGMGYMDIVRAWRMVLSRDNNGQYKILAQTLIAHLKNIDTLHLEFSMGPLAFYVFNCLALIGKRRLLKYQHKPAEGLWPHLQACTLLVGGAPEEIDFFERDVASYYPSTTLGSCKGLLSLAPHISSLHLRSFIGTSYDATFLKNLTQLHLQCGDFRGAESLHQALRSICNLQVFSFEWAYNEMADEGGTGFGGITLAEVVETLRTLHKDTLKRLQLGYPAAHYNIDDWATLPWLNDFAVLEELKIHGTSIPELRDGAEETFLINLLPVSIRRLHIMYAGQSQVDQLVELAKDSQQPSTARKLPHLCEVTVMTYCPAEGSEDNYGIDSILDSPGWQGLQSDFEKIDIAFSARTSSQIEWDICEF